MKSFLQLKQCSKVETGPNLLYKFNKIFKLLPLSSHCFFFFLSIFSSWIRIQKEKRMRIYAYLDSDPFFCSLAFQTSCIDRNTCTYLYYLTLYSLKWKWKTLGFRIKYTLKIEVTFQQNISDCYKIFIFENYKPCQCHPLVWQSWRLNKKTMCRMLHLLQYFGRLSTSYFSFSLL